MSDRMEREWSDALDEEERVRHWRGAVKVELTLEVSFEGTVAEMQEADEKVTDSVRYILKRHGDVLSNDVKECVVHEETEWREGE
mgnify:CR=1 FL=1